jgi:hypothetical protein
MQAPAASEGEAVAARAPAAQESAGRPAAAAPSDRKETFGPELKEKVEAAQAEARRDGPGEAASRETPGGPGLQEPPGVTETGTHKIRKGFEAFHTSPPPETAKPPAEKAPPSDGSGRWSPPERPAAAAEPTYDRSDASSSSMERPRNREQDRGPSRPPQRSQTRSPQVQKFVLEEERGSPILLLALGFIILLAAGVILYSFNIL